MLCSLLYGSGGDRLCSGRHACQPAVSKCLARCVCIPSLRPAHFYALSCRYFGPLGFESSALIAYLEAVPGVQPIRAGSNPATWCVDVACSKLAALGSAV